MYIYQQTSDGRHITPYTYLLFMVTLGTFMRASYLRREQRLYAFHTVGKFSQLDITSIYNTSPELLVSEPIILDVVKVR